MKKAVGLVARHEEFLRLVQSHGKGSISVNYVHDKFAELVFVNKDKKNCITGAMMYQLAQAVDQLLVEVKNNHRPLCLLIRGEGTDTFSSGADLQLVHDLINSPVKGEMMSRFMTEALNSLRNSSIISACAVNGLALGGGSELTTVGDFRIFSNNPDHYISFFHAKIGAMPGWGGINRLVSIVGRRNAIKMCGESRKVYAKEGLEMGLVDTIIPIRSESDWSIAGQDFFAPYLDQKYHKSILAMKEIIAAADTFPAIEALQIEQENFKHRWYADDHAKVMANIAKKRVND
jgi:enoyl-CoA hydratase/carnithine racemase